MSWLNWFSKQSVPVDKSVEEKLLESMKTNMALNEAIRALYEAKEEALMERELIIIALVENAGGVIEFEKEFIKDAYARGLEYKLDDKGEYYRINTFIPADPEETPPPCDGECECDC